MLQKQKSLACLVLVVLLGAGGRSLLPAQDSQLHQESPIVTAGSEYGYPPYCIVNENGEADGFSVELLREALNAMGMEVDYTVGQWTEVKDALQYGRVEVLPLVGRTPEREDMFDFTFPYLTMNGAIIVHKDTESIRSIEDLQDKTVAVLKGDNAEEFVLRRNLGSAVISTATSAQALSLAAEKRVDAVVMQRLLALQIIQDEGFADLRITGPPIMEFKQSFCFAVQKGNSQLLSLLNEGLSIIIADGTYDRLYSKWFGPLQGAGRRVDRIVVGGDSEYPPYEFLDENGEPAGFNVDLTRALAQEIGIEVEIVLDQWAKTYDRLLNGEVDIVQGVFYSLERDSILSYTQPHSILSHVIVTRKHEYPSLKTFEDLEGLEILVMDQDIMHHKALEFGYEKQIIAVSSQEEALRLLASGRGDCALAAEMPARYWIEKNGFDNLTVGADVLRLDYCYAAMDESEAAALIMEFSEGLTTLRAQGTYRTISNKWFSVYEEQETTLADILKILAFILVPAGIIVLSMLLWSLMLRKKVRERTAELQGEVLQREAAQKLTEASEKKFREYIIHAPIGVFVTDREGRYLDVNPAAERITGYTREELLQMGIGDFAADGENQKTEQTFRDMLSTGHLSETMRFRRKDGTTGYWTLEAAALSGESFLGFTVDITELKEREKEISEDRERLNVTLRSIGDGVITTDIRGHVQLMNKVAEQLTGWTQAEAVGKNLKEVFSIVHEYTGEVMDNPVEQVIQTGLIVEFSNHAQLVSKTGERYIVADSGAPIRDMKSEIIGIVLVFRDTTHEVRMKEQMQRTDKLESLGVMAGGIAHDFNNLLSGIFGYIELARDASANGLSSDEYLQEIVPIMDRARGLTQQLLTFARGGNPVREVKDIRDIITENAAFALSGSSVTLEFDISPDLWPCYIDVQQIVQVIDNIVINAKQAMPKGGTITIAAENTVIRENNIINLNPGEYVHISVQDTGTGIPKNVIDKIFDPFFTTKREGNGLGLATCYSIITKHDGMITVESRQGEGAKFHIRLPRSEDSPALHQKRGKAAHSGNGRILVLDDEPYVRNIIRGMLESMGYEVDEAASGEKVLRLCEEVEENRSFYRAAFFDLTVSGGLGGKEIIDTLRAKCPDIPIFAMSGYSADAVMANPKDYGFTASIPKPFKKEELGELLSTYVT